MFAEINDLDFSQYDSAQSALINSIERTKVRIVLGPDMAQLWNAIALQTSTFTFAGRTHKHKALIYSAYCRNSGEMNTAEGNATLTHMLTMYAIFKYSHAQEIEDTVRKLIRESNNESIRYYHNLTPHFPKMKHGNRNAEMG